MNSFLLFTTTIINIDILHHLIPIIIISTATATIINIDILHKLIPIIISTATSVAIIIFSLSSVWYLKDQCVTIFYEFRSFQSQEWAMLFCMISSFALFARILIEMLFFSLNNIFLTFHCCLNLSKKACI